LCSGERFYHTWISGKGTTSFETHPFTGTGSVHKNFVEKLRILTSDTSSFEIEDSRIEHSCTIEIVDQCFTAWIVWFVGDYKSAGIGELDCFTARGGTEIEDEVARFCSQKGSRETSCKFLNIDISSLM
jgi:hypothetical protein